MLMKFFGGRIAENFGNIYKVVALYSSAILYQVYTIRTKYAWNILCDSALYLLTNTHKGRIIIYRGRGKLEKAGSDKAA